MLTLLFVSCQGPALGPASKSTASPAVTAKIATRYAELSRLGTPEKITEEFSHAVVRYTVGSPNFSKLPRWLSEGYPDFVALGPDFTYNKALEAYKNRDPRVNGSMAGDYMLYDVLTAYYLEHKKLKVRDLLAQPPDLEQAEREAFAR